MEEIEELNLSGQELKGLPLFFRKIYYNKITDVREEEKLIKYSHQIQTHLIRDNFPVREISKTVNYNLFNSNKNDR